MTKRSPFWAAPDIGRDGKLKDLVKLAFSSIHHIPNIAGLEAKEYEMTMANIHLNLNLMRDKHLEQPSQERPLSISQATYLVSYDASNPNLPKVMIDMDKNLQDMFFHSQMPPSLPNDSATGEAILLPKSYREAGVKVGNQGHLSYQTPSVSTIQEQRVPIVVAGFYDPGIFPLGNKIILANQALVSMISSAYPQEETGLNNGINVRFSDLDKSELVKRTIQEAFQEAGIDPYWKVETYREYEFTRDFLQQLRSERNLFTLISMVIIIVACSNIISMLIILVNDKKTEIGILRSMGASPKSIAAIFGLCGVVMGVIGSLLGAVAALFTLHHLQSLIDLISKLQGFDAFNPVFFGETLPNEVSIQALAFVLIATSLISLIAGIVPAVKACLLHPSAILRSE